MLEKFKLKTKDFIFIGLLVIGVAFFAYQKITNQNNKNSIDGSTRILEVEDRAIFVTVVTNEESMKKGLSGLDSIEENEGMLFVHTFPSKHLYNMKNVKFDLDFIFLQQEEIVDVAKSVSHRYNGTIKGAVEYDKVIEVNADWVKRNGIEIGDKINFGG